MGRRPIIAHGRQGAHPPIASRDVDVLAIGIGIIAMIANNIVAIIIIIIIAGNNSSSSIIVQAGSSDDLKRALASIPLLLCPLFVFPIVTGTGG